jgi:hypothetical protein
MHAALEECLEFGCCRIDIVLDNSFFDLLVDSVLLSFLKKTQEYNTLTYF